MTSTINIEISIFDFWLTRNIHLTFMAENPFVHIFSPQLATCRAGSRMLLSFAVVMTALRRALNLEKLKLKSSEETHDFQPGE
jgi:hypothetical protein